MRLKMCLAVMLAVLFLPFLALNVSANGPGTISEYYAELSNLPENARYADLLIPLSTEDPEYCEVPSQGFPEGIAKDAQIIQYAREGYMSYTFHYSNASSKIAIKNGNVRFFCEDLRHMDAISEKGQVKLAVLDAEGNILQISEGFDLVPHSLIAISAGVVFYDAAADSLQVEQDVSVWMIALYLVVSVVGLWITVAIELLIAGMFRFRGSSLGVIAVTNIVSQLVMRILFLVLYGPVFRVYALLVLVLEVLIYVCEFVVYRRYIKGISPKRLLCYTVAANTATLVVGCLLNSVFL